MINLFKNTLYNDTFNIKYNQKEIMKNILSFIKNIKYARNYQNAIFSGL